MRSVGEPRSARGAVAAPRVRSSGHTVWTGCLAVLGSCVAPPSGPDGAAAGPVLEVVCDPAVLEGPADGRVLVYLSKHDSEPRAWNNPARLEPVLALDVRGLRPGDLVRFEGAGVEAFPVPPDALEGGAYLAQAVLDLDPHAPWPGTAPGNPCSAPVPVELGAEAGSAVRLVLDRTVPETLPRETRTVRVVDVESRLLTEFTGRPVRLRALVHLPEAWFATEARLPAYYSLSGFGASFAGFRSVDWPAPPIEGEPFVVVYPDPSCSTGHSAFTDSEVNGPWGRALVEELVPEVERRFGCIADREARFLAGHSSGGWAALSLMVRHPEAFGAAWASSPDPVDFRDFMGVDLYAPGANLLFDEEGNPRPFCTLGGWTVNYTVEHARREELLRGGVLRFFEALHGPAGPDGRARELFDRATGAVDPEVAAHWRRNDLSLVLRERWDELGPLLDGRVVVTVGDGDNFLLAGSVELLAREVEALGGGIEVQLFSGDHFSVLDRSRSRPHAASLVERYRTWRDRGER